MSMSDWIEGSGVIRQLYVDDLVIVNHGLTIFRSLLTDWGITTAVAAAPDSGRPFCKARDIPAMFRNLVGSIVQHRPNRS